MNKQQVRYKNMERKMQLILAALSLLFVIFLIAAGIGIIWLKAICAIVTISLSLLCLFFLYLADEILKPRSLWISIAFAALVVCTLSSLLLQFPSPRP